MSPFKPPQFRGIHKFAQLAIPYREFCDECAGDGFGRFCVQPVASFGSSEFVVRRWFESPWGASASNSDSDAGLGLGSGALDSARSWFGFAFWSLLPCVWSFLSSSGVVGTHAANRALLHLITFSLFEFLDLLVVLFLFFENIPRVDVMRSDLGVFF